MAAQDSIPGSDLSPAQRKWCELVAIQGEKYAHATRACYPSIKSVYSKAWQLRRNEKLQVYLSHLEAEALKEPRRILKKFMKSMGRIAAQPDHKNFVGSAQIISRLSGLEQQETKDIKVEVKLRKYDPEEDDS